MPADWNDMVTVGRIVRPHGHRGAVVVAPESDFAADRFAPGSELWWARNGAAARVRIESSREFRGRWIVTLDGVASMNEAETLRNLEFRVPADELKALGPAAYYVHDLRDCRVVTGAGEEIGRVRDVEFGSGTPTLVVAGGGGDEVLVPLAGEICREIDPAGKRIVIDPPGGLIELNRAARR